MKRLFVWMSSMLLGMCLIILPAHANNRDAALLEHGHAVAKAISAMYMLVNSKGNPKYQTELDQYKQQANDSMGLYGQNNGEFFHELNPRWEKLAPQFKVIVRTDLGWMVDNYLRRDLRHYLSDVYQKLAGDEMGPFHQRQWTVFQLDVVTSRFFDIANATNGPLSLSPSDEEKVNVPVINQQIKTALEKFLQQASPADQRRLKSVKTKWEFIENSVVNYSSDAAPFLVYASKSRIAKDLLLNTQQLSAQ